MADFSLTCPHCSQDRSTFLVLSVRQAPANIQIAGACRRCEGMVVISLQGLPQTAYSNTIMNSFRAAQGFADLSRCVVTDMWPRPRKLAAPQATPEHVEKNWIEAEKSRRQEAHVAAAIMYRLTLETALQIVHPKEGKQRRLIEAIDAAATAGKITPDLRDWVHHIRLVGNEAAHEGGSPEEIAELANLTQMMLVYLFELPDKVARMRASKAPDGDGNAG